MDFNAAIFDLDGTITNSGEGIMNCIRYALEQMGREIPAEQTLRKFVGPPLVVGFREYTDLTEEEAKTATAKYRERYQSEGLFEAYVYEGFEAVLKYLKKTQVKIAVATSKCLARKGEKGIYVNLEKNGDPDIFFNGEGQFTLGDVIYALKSKKQNLTIKIESSLKKSVEGVEYLAAPKIALDFLELQISEIKTLLNEISTSFDYDYIIVDCRSEYDELSKMVWNMADKVIVVSDGSEISNSKTERMSHSIEVLENDEDSYSFAKAHYESLLFEKRSRP